MLAGVAVCACGGSDVVGVAFDADDVVSCDGDDAATGATCAGASCDEPGDAEVCICGAAEAVPVGAIIGEANSICDGMAVATGFDATAG